MSQNPDRVDFESTLAEVLSDGALGQRLEAMAYNIDVFEPKQRAAFLVEAAQRFGANVGTNERSTPLSPPQT
jgi:hypothetical protein